MKETQSIIRTIMESQAKISTGGEGKSSDDIVSELSEVIVNSIITVVSTEDAQPSLFTVLQYYKKRIK